MLDETMGENVNGIASGLFRVGVTASLAAALVTSVGLSPVSADSGTASPSAVEDAVTKAVTAAGQPGSIQREASESSSGTMRTQGPNGLYAEVPRNAGAPVTMSTSSGRPISFDLPTTATAQNATVVNGTAVYADPASHTASAVQVLTDGSVRALVTIADVAARKDYSFDLRLPAGGGAEVMDDGSVDLIDAEGVTYGSIAPAWAVDAKGVAVPTSYEIVGSTLVQHVGFTASTAFPVVADPTFKGDCGILTCTIRLNRAATRNARDASWIVAGAGSACAVVASGVGAVVCGAAVAPASVVLAVAAGRYYEDGDCLGIRFSLTPPPFNAAWPVRVKARKYNCR